MTRWLLAATVVLGLSIAGCAGKGAEASDPNPSVSPSESGSANTSTTGTPITDQPTELPSNQLLLTDCTGANVFRNYPAPLAPGTRPEGWEPRSADNLLSSVSILAFTCNRIALGAFERGPTRLLFEWHGNLEAPDQCQKNTHGITLFGVLQNVVVEDSELGAYLATEYGMPVSVATFTESETDASAGSLHHRSWTIDGLTSAVSVLESQSHQDPPDYERYFWSRGEGLVALDLDIVHQGPQVDHVANGTFNAPMLLGSDTAGTFVGHGDWYPTAQATGIFTEYSDRECMKPEP